MRRILFFWRGRPVYSYPAMLYLGLVAGVAAGNIAAHAAGMDAFRVYAATILLLIPALAGSRLLHVVSHWSYYRSRRSLIWKRSEGGLAQYGGLLLAVPVSIPLLAVIGVPFGAFWDVASITILTGMIFTRVGCHLNGCCAGRPSMSRTALFLPNHAGVWARRIPTQLLEAGWATMLLALALALRAAMPFPGALFLLVASGYASGRLLLESGRDNASTGEGFTLHHFISLLIIVLSAGAVAGGWLG